MAPDAGSELKNSNFILIVFVIYVKIKIAKAVFGANKYIKGESKMIDFSTDTVFKLKQVDLFDGEKMVSGLLVEGEFVLSAYRTVRDMVIFTNKRVISVNVQKLTGKKKDFTSLPYKKISVFSIETSGVMDVDSELDMWFSGLGHVRFEFSGRSDIIEIGRTIAVHTI